VDREVYTFMTRREHEILRINVEHGKTRAEKVEVPYLQSTLQKEKKPTETEKGIRSKFE
jgi:hypothetical protein